MFDYKSLHPPDFIYFSGSEFSINNGDVSLEYGMVGSDGNLLCNTSRSRMTPLHSGRTLVKGSLYGFVVS